MPAHFELWHGEGGSIIGTWQHEDDALVIVRDMVQAYGPSEVESWALLRDGDPDSDLILVAEGAALIKRAQTITPTE